MVSVSLLCAVVWNGGGVYYCCPARLSVCGCAMFIPVQYSPVVRSCGVLRLAGRVVCVACVSVCAVRVVGYPLSTTPS